MRVDTGDGEHRFAVSLAGYGYMGDLMEASEKLRWMGPPRYTTAGAVTLFKGQTYHAKISYRPADSSRSAFVPRHSMIGPAWISARQMRFRAYTGLHYFYFLYEYLYIIFILFIFVFVFIYSYHRAMIPYAEINILLLIAFLK
jgi:hypothetical protein